MRRVAFNAPLYTGLFVDARAAVRDQFTAVQDAIESASLPPGQWDVARSKVRASGLQIDVDNRRGVTIMPRYIVERRLQGEQMAAVLDALDLPRELADENLGARFVADTIAVRQLDFGYASLLVEGEITCGECSDIKAFRAMVEGLSSQVPCWTALVEQTRTALQDILPEDYLLQSNSENSLPAPIVKQRDEAGAKMLWVHRIFQFRRGDPLVDEQGEVEAVVFRYQPDDVRNLSIDDAYDCYVGVGNSLVIAGDDADPADLDVVPRVVAMQNVYWARLESFDVELFHYVNELSIEVDQRNISGFDKIQALEEKSQEIVDLLEYAELFRSAYNDYAYHLDPQSRVLWQEIVSCWGTDNRFDAVNNKLATLEKMYDRVRGSLRSLYDSQLNTFVIFFTLFGLMSVAVDMIGFVQEGSFRGVDYLRIGILGMMLVGLSLVGWKLLGRRTPL